MLRLNCIAIAQIVAEYADIHIDDLLSDYRNNKLCIARGIVVVLIRENTEISFPQIVHAFCFYKSHSSAMGASRKVIDLIESGNDWVVSVYTRASMKCREIKNAKRNHISGDESSAPVPGSIEPGGCLPVSADCRRRGYRRDEASAALS